MGSKRKKLYKKCIKCNNHAYLTVAGCYICTVCGYIEGLDSLLNEEER